MEHQRQKQSPFRCYSPFSNSQRSGDHARNSSDDLPSTSAFQAHVGMMPNSQMSHTPKFQRSATFSAEKTSAATYNLYTGNAFDSLKLSKPHFKPASIERLYARPAAYANSQPTACSAFSTCAASKTKWKPSPAARIPPIPEERQLLKWHTTGWRVQKPAAQTRNTINIEERGEHKKNYGKVNEELVKPLANCSFKRKHRELEEALPPNPIELQELDLLGGKQMKRCTPKPSKPVEDESSTNDRSPGQLQQSTFW